MNSECPFRLWWRQATMHWPSLLHGSHRLQLVYLAHTSILIGYFHQAQAAISLHFPLSRHCVLTWIMTVLTMDNTGSMWQVNNNLTDLTWRSHNLYLVQNTPSFWDKTQGLCSLQRSSQSSVWSSFPLWAITQTTRVRERERGGGRRMISLV